MSQLEKMCKVFLCGYEAKACCGYCIEKMLLHKWTMQDKDSDIIIIKSEQHHMVRERKST